MATVSYKFYTETYGGSLIPESSFLRVANDALKRIEMRTAWRVSTLSSEAYAEDLKSCTCEVAEELYRLDQAKGSDGMVMSSYNNDGESASFDAASMSESALAARLETVMQKWLVKYGLLYTGVDCYA